MGICYGVEKDILDTGINHERFFDEGQESDMYNTPAQSEDINGKVLDVPDGAERNRVKDKKRQEEEKKERKKNREKKKRHKSSKKESKDKEKDRDKDKVDLKSPDEYLYERMKLDVHVLHPPTDGKKCLVLDIDYTIFDHKSDFDLAQEFKRPYLHEFLKVCSIYYDIVIWSATAMCHIQTKMEKLRLLNHPDFNISIVLSKEFMIPYAFPGKRRVHVQDIKPLPVIWRKFDNVYNATNTIHIDDVVENFALNPQNGLRIEPFKDALRSRQTDKELFYLTQYLLLIGHLPSLEGLDHMKWKDYIINRLFEVQNVLSLPEFMVPPPPSTSLLAHHQTVLIARSETSSKDKDKDKERKRSQTNEALPPVQVIHIEVGEHGPKQDFVWESTSTMPPLVQL